jgi:hypothetical protein
MTDLTLDGTLLSAPDPAVEISLDLEPSTDDSVEATTVKELMRRAARRAAERGASLESFMSAAYGAFLDINPDVREQLAEAQMLAEIQALRSAGKVGSA